MNPLRENLQTLLRVADTKGQIESFLEAFKVAVDTLNKMKTASQAELSMLRVTFDQAVQSLKDTNLKDFTDIKGQLETQIGITLDAAMKEQADSLNFIRDKVRKIKEGRDGAPGAPGKNADEQAIIQAVLAQIPPDVEETGDEIIDKINAADKLISASAIVGLEDELKKIGESAKRSGNIPGWGAHPLNIYQSSTLKAETARHLNFTGATVTQSPAGVTTIAVGGGSATIYSETPTGAVDGANKAYTTVHATTTILTIAINGQFIHPSEYTTNASGFTMGTALPADLSTTGFTVVYT